MAGGARVEFAAADQAAEIGMFPDKVFTIAAMFDTLALELDSLPPGTRHEALTAAAAIGRAAGTVPQP